MYGPSFYAKDPIRIVFETPKMPPIGTNYGVTGRPGSCPALVLADFQIDLAISTSTPPNGITESNPIRVGMSRAALIWTWGFPWEIADRKSLLKENVWHYGIGLAAYTVYFKNGEVARIRGMRSGAAKTRSRGVR